MAVSAHLPSSALNISLALCPPGKFHRLWGCWESPRKQLSSQAQRAAGACIGWGWLQSK